MSSCKVLHMPARTRFAYSVDEAEQLGFSMQDRPALRILPAEEAAAVREAEVEQSADWMAEEFRLGRTIREIATEWEVPLCVVEEVLRSRLVRRQ